MPTTLNLKRFVRHSSTSKINNHQSSIAIQKANIGDPEKPAGERAGRWVEGLLLLKIGAVLPIPTPRVYNQAIDSAEHRAPKIRRHIRMTAVKAYICVFIALGSSLVGSSLAGSSLMADETRRPIPLIFDTDIGNDVDDVLALGMIHALQSRGECELLAVTITKDHELAAPFVDAVNTFYGRGNIPIGVCRSGVTRGEGKFIGLAAKRDHEKLRYPHDLLSGNKAPGAVEVLRKTLAGADDGSVVIAQVGFSTNLAKLLDSPPDEHSSQTGFELVKKKVRLLSIMAGAFKQIAGKDGQLHDHREYNIVQDIRSAKKLAAEWPTPIVWSGFEIGLSLLYPHQSIQRDYSYVEHHPLADAYVLYNPPPHDRPTWDLTSVLYAVRPDRGYFDISKPGRVVVADDGLTTFEQSADGRHRHLIASDERKLKTREALQLLASQPRTQR